VVAVWDIDAAGVQAVLSRTESEAAPLDTFGAELNTELTGALTESSSQLVAASVQGLMDVKMTDIEFVYTRIGSATQAAYAATSAYLAGDVEMAANAQAAATAAPGVPAPGAAGGSRAAAR